VQRQGTVEGVAPTRDACHVPARPVLIREEHQLAAVEAGLAARLVEQHECLEAVHLRLVRHQLEERCPEPERFRRQVDAATVALVEDQVDDREHRCQPLRKHIVGRNAEGDAGVPDLALRTREPALQRLFRNKKRASDLLGRETAERAQG
jgi:hypothetical protein